MIDAFSNLQPDVSEKTVADIVENAPELFFFACSSIKKSVILAYWTETKPALTTNCNLSHDAISALFHDCLNEMFSPRSRQATQDSLMVACQRSLWSGLKNFDDVGDCLGIPPKILREISFFCLDQYARDLLMKSQYAPLYKDIDAQILSFPSVNINNVPS